ncbi:MAG: hypothetical protein ACI9WU_003900, partial [Myxococcota bacterium]
MRNYRNIGPLIRRRIQVKITTVVAISAALTLFATNAIAQPTITGHVDTDFDLDGTVTIIDPDGIDVGVPNDFPLGTISGNDMAALRLYHDIGTDTLYVGFDTYGIAGDVDGNGNPSLPGSVLVELGGTDHPAFGVTETFGVAFDFDEDGDSDVIVGVGNTGDLSSFGTRFYLQNPIFGSWFGAEVAGHQATLLTVPSVITPDIEFTIPNFSTLRALMGGTADKTTRVTAHMGSLEAAGIGVDWIFSQPLCLDADGDGLTICQGDCDDTDSGCLSDCSDNDNDGIADCKGSCVDGDGDGYGIGIGCVGLDCNDAYPECIQDCTNTDNDVVPDCGDDDDDNDGLKDISEIAIGTDPLNPDTDGGGVNDGFELIHGTNPLDPGDDSQICVDGDGDGYGVGFDCLGPDCDDSEAACNVLCVFTDSDDLPDCIDTDDDNDGLADTVETFVGTDPLNPDTDGGGASDFVEVQNGTEPINTPEDDGVCNDNDGDGYGIGQCIGLDCNDSFAECTTDCSDFDNDGLPNCADLDDDNDGLKDVDEALIGTDPLDQDTDDGGATDLQELIQGTNPVNNPADDFAACVDNDGDGFGTGAGCNGPDCNDGFATCTTECIHSDDDGVPNCADSDDDDDGAPDDIEAVVGTDPLDPDTDDGGVTDGKELANGTDPLNPADDSQPCIDSDGDGFGVGATCLGPDCNDGFATCTTSCVHNDGDGIPNCADLDDDGDGLPDLQE